MIIALNTPRGEIQPMCSNFRKRNPVEIKSSWLFADSSTAQTEVDGRHRWIISTFHKKEWVRFLFSAWVWPEYSSPTECSSFTRNLSFQAQPCKYGWFADVCLRICAPMNFTCSLEFSDMICRHGFLSSHGMPTLILAQILNHGRRDGLIAWENSHIG